VQLSVLFTINTYSKLKSKAYILLIKFYIAGSIGLLFQLSRQSRPVDDQPMVYLIFMNEMLKFSFKKTVMKLGKIFQIT